VRTAAHQHLQLRRWHRFGSRLAPLLLVIASSWAGSGGQAEGAATGLAWARVGSPSSQADAVAIGATLFQADFNPEQGLGPLFNARACVDCHSSPVVGGMGTEGLGIVRRVGRLEAGQVDPLIGRGGPTAREHSVAELGHSCGLPVGLPAEANVVSLRNAPPLFGAGLVEAIPDDVILANAAPRADGVQGRPNLVTVGGQMRVGRFGWKAEIADLDRFVAEALRSEHGITSPLAPDELIAPAAPGTERCAGQGDDPEDDGSLLLPLAAFVRSLPAPKSEASTSEQGDLLFAQAGCAACHVPALSLDGQQVRLYSDLLLHDLGPRLDDGMRQGAAGGRDWRTTPLWGLSSRTRYLHDGRARSLRAALLAHGGEAQPALDGFRQLSTEDQERLLAFLGSL
jgi:CxxC motif-containing protein (DUF1111 family)